jgi:hypothetical protein
MYRSRLFGGSSQAQAQDVPAPVAAQAANQIADQGAQCAVQAKSFTQCLDATGSDMGSCAYYFGACSVSLFVVVAGQALTLEASTVCLNRTRRPQGLPGRRCSVLRGLSSDGNVLISACLCRLRADACSSRPA